MDAIDTATVGGTVVDLRQLDAVAHLCGDLVSIGPGARWGSVARSLFDWGLALTSGYSGDVGVGDSPRPEA